jgi:hypothetical protein
MTTTTETVTYQLGLRGGAPQVNHERMNSTLQLSCQWGSTPDGGMSEIDPLTVELMGRSIDAER